MEKDIEKSITCTYILLVRKNFISKDTAANEMGISVAELEEKLQENVAFSCRH